MLNLICISAILTVSAVDNNSIVLNETNNTTDNINTNSVVSNATTFKELQQDINKYSNIQLSHDITRDGSQAIEISKTVIIDGNGHTIDGENLTIFHINSKGNFYIKKF